MTTITIDDIAARLIAAPFDPAATDTFLDEIDEPMRELYDRCESDADYQRYRTLSELRMAVAARVREERPWTLFTTCSGTQYVWVPGGHTAAFALLAAYLGADPHRKCGQCGDFSWDDTTYEARSPDEHTDFRDSGGRVTILGPDAVPVG